MKTTSVIIMNLCVPCANHCRYCLLSYDGKLRGIDYMRSQTYAQRFYHWAKEHRPDLQVMFAWGYSMEHPQLLEAVDFLHSIGSPGGEFLQMDGMKFRTESELRQLFSDLMAHGIKMIDLTFYGTWEYHDRFAARKGDFDYMIDMLRIANEIGLDVHCDVPLSHENTLQADELLQILNQYRCGISFFVPHAEGRGITLNPVRFREEDYNLLSDAVKQRFNRQKFKPESQWVQENQFSLWEQRSMTLSLTPENIDFFEQISFDEAIQYLDKLDDDYFAVMPPLSKLVKLYGNPTNSEFYNERDLYLKYQRRYIEDNQLSLYDINDERQCSCRRF